jgi:hypothetical protein
MKVVAKCKANRTPLKVGAAKEIDGASLGVSLLPMIIIDGNSSKQAC